MFIFFAVLLSFLPVHADDNPCASPQFFKKYLRNSKTKGDFFVKDKGGAGEVRLTAYLHINTHTLPGTENDDYGNELEVQFLIKPDSGACALRRAFVTQRPTGKNDSRAFKDEPFDADISTYNLQRDSLNRIILRSQKRRAALLLTPDKYFYYEGVEGKGELTADLAPADDNVPLKTWGGSYNELFKK